MTAPPWARVYRDAWDSLDTGQPLTPRERYVDLCLRYQIADSDGLEAGQCRVSRGMLAKAWRCELSTAASFLKGLVKRGLINIFPQGRSGSLVARTEHEPKQNRTRTEHPEENDSDNAELGNSAAPEKPKQNRTRTEHEPIGAVENVRKLPKLRRKFRPSRARRDLDRDIDLCTTDVVHLDIAGAGGHEGAKTTTTTTTAARARAYPALASLARRGPSYDWPAEFRAFLVAYPAGAGRAPGPGTYRSWRRVAIDVDGGASILLRSAERYAATVTDRRFVRRAHGPSGWIESGDWMHYAEQAEQAATPQHTGAEWAGGIDVPDWLDVPDSGWRDA